MTQSVTMPNGDIVDFPDTMPPEQIKSLIAKKFPTDVASHFQNLASGLQSGMSWSDIAKNAVSNVPSSAVQFGENVAQPFMHPIETAQNIGGIGKGVLQKLGLMSGKDSEKYADAIGKFFVDRYGSEDAIKNTIAKDPVGALADVATVLSGGELALGRAPGTIGEIGRAAGKISRAVNPLSAVGVAAKGAGKIGSEVLGVSTGAGSQAIETAARAGASGGQASKEFLANLTAREAPESAILDAKSALQQIRQERGNVYRQEMAKIGANSNVLNFNKIDAAVNNVAKIKTYKGQVISPKTQVIRDELVQAVNGWKGLDPKQFHTAEGLDALKQKIGEIRDATQFGTPDRVVADNVYHAIKSTIVKEAPDYAKVMKGYEEASSLIKEMEKTLSLNPSASVDTQLRKLQSSLRDNVNTNYGRRAELIKFLSRAGAPHLMEKLAGQSLQAGMPRGIARLAVSGEGAGAAGALASGNPALAAALMATLGAHSPFAVGLGAYGAGAITRLPLRNIGLGSRALGATGAQ